MGVSGGYQSARRGPSMSPGGSKRAVDEVLPLLENFAAKDVKGIPCGESGTTKCWTSCKGKVSS